MAYADIESGELGFVRATEAGIIGKLRALGPLTGLTNIARAKAAMIRSARRVILLADSSKWGHTTFAKIAPLLEIDVLVTDSGLPESERKAIRRFCATLPKSGRIHR